MYVLRRLFQDGSDRPELVLIHYSASPENSPDVLLVRSTAVVVPTGIPGTRQGHLFLPRPPEGRLAGRYSFDRCGGRNGFLLRTRWLSRDRTPQGT